MRRAATASLLRGAVLLALAALFEAACRLHWVDPLTYMAPTRMVAALWHLLASGRVTGAVLVTLRDVLIAFGAAFVAGTAGAVLLFRFATLRALLDPLLGAYYAVPIFVFYPLLIVVFGLNALPQIVIGFLAAVVAVVVATLNGLDRVPRALLKTAKVLHLSPVQTALRVTLPAAQLHMFTGVKLGLGYAFTGVIGAQFILSGSGIGYEINIAYAGFDNATMYPMILLVVIAATALNMALHARERALLRRIGRA